MKNLQSTYEEKFMDLDNIPLENKYVSIPSNYCTFPLDNALLPICFAII